PIMGTALWTALLVAALLAGDANATTASEVEQLIREATATLDKASAAGGEWRNSRKLLKKARAAAKEGDLNQAVLLAGKAKREGELAYTQAKAENAKVPTLMTGAVGAARDAGAVAFGAITAKYPAIAGSNAARAGKELAFDGKKGNCLACHMMGDGVGPGNLGPPLISMQARFPSKAALWTQIWDPRLRIPESIMPPFGRHMILSDAEISKIVEYLWSL
ncbi:MAG: sulfur oxidation c-type cytochrome SoxX, partial [Gammaproteobacteria bacterium]